MTLPESVRPTLVIATPRDDVAVPPLDVIDLTDAAPRDVVMNDVMNVVMNDVMNDVIDLTAITPRGDVINHRVIDLTTITPPDDVIDLTVRTRPSVVVSVGTDHHPFDRLVQWMDGWAQHNPDIDVVIQHGSAEEPRHAQGTRFLSHSELVSKISEAAIVVSHGGPATISEAWRAGMIPIVAPRGAGLGEHVDNHQQTFVGVLAAREQVVEVKTQEQLSDALDRALEDPSWLRRESGHAWDVSASLRNVETVIANLTVKRPARRSIFERVMKRLSG
jgi:UDP-N-acetylglucosamine transferase subunit ALG13